MSYWADASKNQAVARPMPFAIFALATWRVTHLLVEEDGPSDLVLRLRDIANSSVFGQVMDCFYCASVWVALPFAVVLTLPVVIRSGAVASWGRTPRVLVGSAGDVGSALWRSVPSRAGDANGGHFGAGRGVVASPTRRRSRGAAAAPGGIWIGGMSCCGGGRRALVRKQTQAPSHSQVARTKSSTHTSVLRSSLRANGVARRTTASGSVNAVGRALAQAMATLKVER